MSEQEREMIRKASDEAGVVGHGNKKPANEEGPGQETDDPQLTEKLVKRAEDDVEGHGSGRP